MEPRYFACINCRVYVHALVWCYIKLEHPGVVRPGDVIDVDGILSDENLWHSHALPDERAVRKFLEAHKRHRVLFWSNAHLPNDLRLNWLTFDDPDSSPRFYVEVLKMTDWDNVVRWWEALGRRWASDEQRDEFRRAFEDHLDRFRGG
ncbi:MAG TPA: hypothetical protein VH475_09310 [Tepidisphaeraceae bacterium]